MVKDVTGKEQWGGNSIVEENMDFDIKGHLGAVERTVSSLVHDGRARLRDYSCT